MTSLRSWSVPLIFVYLFSTLLIAGCGKPTLDTIKVEPVAATLTVGQSLHLRATGLDAKGQPIEGLTFTWSVLEDSGRIDATGLFTAFKPGTATVTVALGTVQSTATLTVEREQAAQLVAAVEPPEVTTGQQVHLTVTVQNAEGRGIATVPVQAQPTSPDTAIDPPSAPTDANGQATFTITVARQAMVNQVQLSADGRGSWPAGCGAGCSGESHPAPAGAFYPPQQRHHRDSRPGPHQSPGRSRRRGPHQHQRGREPYTPYDCRAAAPGRRDPRHRQRPFSGHPPD
jgi:hypothetical protein